MWNISVGHLVGFLGSFLTVYSGDDSWKNAGCNLWWLSLFLRILFFLNLSIKMTLPDISTHVSKKKKSSLRWNITEDRFHTIGIKVILSCFQNLKCKDSGNHGHFFSLLTLNPCCRNCGSSTIPQGNFLNVGATRTGVAVRTWMTSGYFLAAEYLALWVGFLVTLS